MQFSIIIGAFLATLPITLAAPATSLESRSCAARNPTPNWPGDISDDDQIYDQYCRGNGVISCCDRGDNGGNDLLDLSNILGDLLGGQCGQLNLALLGSNNIHESCGQQQAACCQGDSEGRINRSAKCSPIGDQ